MISFYSYFWWFYFFFFHISETRMQFAMTFHQVSWYNCPFLNKKCSELCRLFIRNLRENPWEILEHAFKKGYSLIFFKCICIRGTTPLALVPPLTFWIFPAILWVVLYRCYTCSVAQSQGFLLVLSWVLPCSYISLFLFLFLCLLFNFNQHFLSLGVGLVLVNKSVLSLLEELTV